MRNISKVVSTGCFFLCLGGWVYNGQVSRAQEATQAREAALNTAVQQAVTETTATPAAPVATAAPTIATAAETPEPQAAQQVAPAVQGGAGTTTTATTGPDLNRAVVNVGVDGRVEQFSVQDMDINTALHFLSLQTKRNIIASRNVKGAVTANLYNVTFAEALDAILRPNGFEYIEKGNFIYVYTAEEYKTIKERDRKTVPEIFRLKYVTAQDAAVLMKPYMSSAGAMALTPAALSGLASGNTDLGGPSYNTDDLVVVNDYPENITAMREALATIDVRPKQVLIEATIMNASLNDTNALGIDLIALQGVDFSTLSSAGFSTGGSTGTDTGGDGEGSGGTPITGPNGLFNKFMGDRTQTNVGTDFAGKVPSGGLSVGFLGNNISFFMRALEEMTDTTIVANPKILALNKQKGEVHIGQKLGYLTTTTSQTTTNQTVQFLDVGTKLVFRPYIKPDGYIQMEIHPEDSSGFVDSRGVPQTNTTEVTSNLMIPDGRTVVIGGLFGETTTAARGQVPVLGNIPILGVAFRRTNDTTIRQETIVLITPHIINDDTSLYEESKRQAEDVSRMQLGNRAGIQPWGRDRIAHIWYARAQEELAAGNTQKALMFTDWALNTNPRFLEAIKLREELTAKKMDDVSSSAINHLVKNVLNGDGSRTPDKGGAGNYPPATKPAAGN